MKIEEKDENIIDGKQKRKFKIIEGVFSIFGWSLMLGYLIQIIATLIIWWFSLSNFYEKLFRVKNLENTIKTIFITIMISLLLFILMYIWGKYNYKKYAHLNRRRFPKDTTPKDLAEFFDLPVEDILKMQNNKKINLEKTII